MSHSFVLADALSENPDRGRADVGPMTSGKGDASGSSPASLAGWKNEGGAN